MRDMLWWTGLAMCLFLGGVLVLVGIFTSWQSPNIAGLFFWGLAFLAAGYLARRMLR